MVAVKPHFVTIASVGQAVSGSEVFENPSPGTVSGSIACLVTPLAPGEAYQRFGVVLTDPRAIYMEVADAVASASPNAVIAFEGVQFWQKGSAEIHANGDVADCAVVFCSRNQYGF